MRCQPAGPPPTDPPPRTPEQLASAEGFRRIAGVDEAGRGPWAGPVVAAAVILRDTRFAVRIDDCKRLTPRQRAAASCAILARAQVGIGIVSADDIDRRNVLQATLQAMAAAIQDLSTAPDLVLVDGPVAPPLTIPCRALVRGDQRSRLIACASIVAKTVRDGLMAFYDELYPTYGFSRHKGYGTRLHARMLAALGPSPLHRRTFSPVAALLGCDAGSMAEDLRWRDVEVAASA